MSLFQRIYSGILIAFFIAILIIGVIIDRALRQQFNENQIEQSHTIFQFLLQQQDLYPGKQLNQLIRRINNTQSQFYLVLYNTESLNQEQQQKLAQSQIIFQDEDKIYQTPKYILYPLTEPSQSIAIVPLQATRGLIELFFNPHSLEETKLTISKLEDKIFTLFTQEEEYLFEELYFQIEQTLKDIPLESIKDTLASLSQHNSLYQVSLTQELADTDTNTNSNTKSNEFTIDFTLPEISRKTAGSSSGSLEQVSYAIENHDSELVITVFDILSKVNFFYPELTQNDNPVFTDNGLLLYSISMLFSELYETIIISDESMWNDILIEYQLENDVHIQQIDNGDDHFFNPLINIDKTKKNITLEMAMSDLNISLALNPNSLKAISNYYLLIQNTQNDKVSELLDFVSNNQDYIKAALKRQPESQQTEVINHLNTFFPVQLTLSDIQSLDIDDINKQALFEYMPIIYYPWNNAWDNDSEEVLLLINDQQVIRFSNNTNGTNPLPVYFYLFIFIVLVALALTVYLILVPIVKHLFRLAQLTQDYAQGNLDKRIAINAPEPIGHLSLSFNQMAEKLDHILEEQKIMVHAITHDLRTPISRMRLAHDMSQSIGDPDEALAILKETEIDINEMEHLVNELLSFAKVGQQTSLKDVEIDNLNQFIQKEIDKIQRLTKKRIKLISPSTIQCEFETFYLGRAINNLLNNAIVYAKSSINVNMERQNDKIIITVEDDGPGIPENDWSRVFSPFSRLETSRTQGTQKGYGLGLAIVKKIMELYQGDAHVENSPLGGARMVLNWPFKLK